MKEFQSIEEMIHHAKGKAMSLLQIQDRTEQQLREKLLNYGYPSAVVDVAVEYVKSYHYIDDQRYAENYTRYRQENKSKQQIKLELMKKGVNRSLIEQAIDEEYEKDERELIFALLEKKKFSQDMDIKEKNRILAYIMRRGFSLEEIKSCMGQYPQYM